MNKKYILQFWPSQNKNESKQLCFPAFLRRHTHSLVSVRLYSTSTHRKGGRGHTEALVASLGIH